MPAPPNNRSAPPTAMAPSSDNLFPNSNDPAAEALMPMSSRERFNLNYGPRPDGTPGRDGFDLMDVLGLKRHEYTLCLRILRHLCFMYGIDETQSISFQEEHLLQKVFNKFIDTFTEFKGFQDRYWAPHALLYVALKSSSDAWWKNNPELATARLAARAAARTAAKVHKKRGVPNPKGRPKGKAKAAMKAKADANAQKAVETSAAAEDDSVQMVLKNLGDMSIDQVNCVDDVDTEEGAFFSSSTSPVLSHNLSPAGSYPDPFNHTASAPVQTRDPAYINMHDSTYYHDPNPAYSPTPGSVHAPANARVSTPAHTSYNAHGPNPTCDPSSGVIHGPSNAHALPTPHGHTPDPGCPTPGLAHASANTHVMRQAHSSSHGPTSTRSPPSGFIHGSVNTHVPAAHAVNVSYSLVNTRATSQAHTSTRNLSSDVVYAPTDTHAPAVTHTYTRNSDHPASRTAHASAKAYNYGMTPAHLSTHNLDLSRGPTSDFVHAPPNTHIATPADTRVPDPRRGSASGVTHDHVGTRTRTPAEHSAPTHVPVYSCGPDPTTRILDPAHGPGSASAHSRVPSAILALAATTGPLSTVSHVRPAHQSATDPGACTANLSLDLAPKPQPNMRSRSNKETRTQAKAQWGTAFDSGDDLSDPPSASESNRPIESDSEVAAKTAEELEINHETVESQDNAKRNRGGRKKKVAVAPALGIEPAPAASRGKSRDRRTAKNNPACSTAEVVPVGAVTRGRDREKAPSKAKAPARGKAKAKAKAKAN